MFQSVDGVSCTRRKHHEVLALGDGVGTHQEYGWPRLRELKPDFVYLQVVRSAEVNFPLWVVSGTSAMSGIRTGRDPAILVSGARDWTWVTVAYCTGDQHMGNRVARYDDGNGGVRLAQCHDS